VPDDQPRCVDANVIGPNIIVLIQESRVPGAMPAATVISVPTRLDACSLRSGTASSKEVRRGADLRDVEPNMGFAVDMHKDPAGV
jgi:hypothetical protein